MPHIGRAGRRARSRRRQQAGSAATAAVLAVATVALAAAGLAAAFSIASETPGAAAAAAETVTGAESGGTVTTGQTPTSTVETKTFNIVASGDLLLHTPILRRGRDPATGRYDFRPMFAAIRPIVARAALALCHVETPIGAGTPSSYPIFNAPPALANAIRWTGWDACSTASNHSVDKGFAGIRTTRRHLARVGVRATGTARTYEESRRILILRVEGIRIAFLSYTYGTNGIRPPTSWSVNLISRSRVVSDARRARRLGADLVLVNFHWGTEYIHAPNTAQRTLARSLLARRAVNAIVGQHAHVVQPIRWIEGRFVVYGEGNLISNQTSACCPAESQDGLIAVLRVRIAAGKASVTRVDYVPIRVRHPDYRVLDVAARLRRMIAAGRGETATADELRRSYRGTVSWAGRSLRIGPIPRALPTEVAGRAAGGTRSGAPRPRIVPSR